jgi:hypothetical protein
MLNHYALGAAEPCGPDVSAVHGGGLISRVIQNQIIPSSK